MPWFVYVFAAIILMSFNSYLVKLLVKKINPFLILFYQYLLAVPLVIFYSVLSSAKPAGFGYYPIILLGVIYVLAIGFYYAALKKGPLSKVSPIFNLKMLVTVFLGLIVLSEPLTFKLALGLIFGVIGIYLLGGGHK